MSVSSIKLQIIDHKADARPSVKVLCGAAAPWCPQDWETKWKKCEVVSHHILKRTENGSISVLTCVAALGKDFIRLHKGTFLFKPRVITAVYVFVTVEKIQL